MVERPFVVVAFVERRLRRCQRSVND